MAERVTQLTLESLYQVPNAARVTQLTLESLMQVPPHARVTQEAAEALYRRNVGGQITQVALEYLTQVLPHARLTQQAVEILYFGDPAAPGIAGFGVQITPDPIPDKRRPIQYSWIGPYFMRDPKLRVSQEGIEVLVQGDPNLRVSQEGIEVLVVRMPIGKQRTELGQHPDPRRQFDYSFAMGTPYVMAFAPLVSMPADAEIATTQGVSLPVSLDAESTLSTASTALLSALGALFSAGRISATTLIAAIATMDAAGFGGITLSSEASLQAHDDVGADAATFSLSSLFAVPPGVISMAAIASMTTAGFMFAQPVGESWWDLPPTKPNAYRDYSFVKGTAPNRFPVVPQVGAFQVIMIL